MQVLQEDRPRIDIFQLRHIRRMAHKERQEREGTANGHEK